MKCIKGMILLLLVISLIGLAACGDGGGGAAPAPAAETAATTDAGVTVDAGEDRIVITYACPQVVAGLNYMTDCDYAIFITSKFNFEFQGTNLPWGIGTLC